MQALTSLVSLISDISIVVGVVVALRQLQKLHASNELQKESFRKDHERRKKQSTIEYYNVISQENHNLTIGIRAKCPGEAISYEEIVSDSELRSLVVRYLNIMELFAVGLHIGVYDIDTFSLIGRSATILAYTRLKDYIEKRRTRDGYPFMCCEFERLVEILHDPKYSA